VDECKPLHAGATVGRGAVLSYNVVLGAGHCAADYARLSLAEQPEQGHTDDSDDELEAGSYTRPLLSST